MARRAESGRSSEPLTCPGCMLTSSRWRTFRSVIATYVLIVLIRQFGSSLPWPSSVTSACLAFTLVLPPAILSTPGELGLALRSVQVVGIAAVALLVSVFWFSPPPAEAVAILFWAAAEDFYFFGFLQGRWERHPLRWPILASAAAFTIAHVPGRGIAAIGVFPPAIAFAALRARTGSIGPSVLIHATCNIVYRSLF